jgi:hypothetical protein
VLRHDGVLLGDMCEFLGRRKSGCTVRRQARKRLGVEEGVSASPGMRGGGEQILHGPDGVVDGVAAVGFPALPHRATHEDARRLLYKRKMWRSLACSVRRKKRFHGRCRELLWISHCHPLSASLEK